MYNIKDKLVVRGVEALTDCELLALLLDDSGDFELAQSLLDSYSGSLQGVLSEKLSRLRMIDGLGLKRAQRLVVASELGRRSALATSFDEVVVKSSADVVAIFKPILEVLKHEECWVLYLNASNRIVEQQRVSQGGVSSTIVDHRIVVKRALELLSTHIVVVHNHPSGATEPSKDDIEMTNRIKSAAALFDINLLDHIIISSSSEFSFLSAGLI